MMTNRSRILISCPDRPGIVAAVSQCLFKHGANIVQSDQYSTNPDDGTFFMRIEFDLPRTSDREPLRRSFADVAREFNMEWQLLHREQVKRMAIFVSKENHCLNELLWQWQWGELHVEIPMVISNHTLLQKEVEAAGIPFHHVPITPETKQEQELLELQLMEGKVDFIVLARYMQILSPTLLDHYRNRIINIHHSFLPAFVGAKPYHQAYRRGVKIIGATAHYVTEDLDEGPIIEQDVTRVNHKDGPEDLISKGREIERTVLARAVRWHVEDRVIVFGNKTVVFV